jgi:SAM-dependent methyltransferase
LNYESDTRDAYKEKSKAERYRAQYVQGAKWARFTMWKQKRMIRRILAKCNLSASDRLLDFPCGAGYIGRLACQYPARVFAADISQEMVNLARQEFGGENFGGFFLGDLAHAPLRTGAFRCVVVLALMHRLPTEIRREVISSIARLSSEYVVVSYSVASPIQKLKQRILSLASPSYIPAPSSLTYREIVDELDGFDVQSTTHIFPLFSAKAVLLLRKRAS